MGKCFYNVNGKAYCENTLNFIVQSSDGRKKKRITAIVSIKFCWKS